LVLRRVALTGASGMLGRYVLAALASRQISAVAVSRSRPKVLEPNAKWQAWDLTHARTEDELDGMFSGVDALLHVGAIVPHAGESHSLSALLKANVEATFALGQWALKKRISLVYVSGAVVYGETNESCIRETHATTYQCVGGAYGLTKLLAEQVLAELEAEGLRLTVLRPSSIYGAGLHSGMIRSFLNQAATGKTIELQPPEEERVDLVHAADVAEAMLKTLEQEALGVYNIASELPATIIEIAEACIACVGSGALRVAPGPTHRKPRLRFGLCCDLARSRFNFMPRYNLSEGICEMWRKSQRDESTLSQ